MLVSSKAVFVVYFSFGVQIPNPHIYSFRCHRQPKRNMLNTKLQILDITRVMFHRPVFPISASNTIKPLIPGTWLSSSGNRNTATGRTLGSPLNSMITSRLFLTVASLGPKGQSVLLQNTPLHETLSPPCSSYLIFLLSAEIVLIT